MSRLTDLEYVSSVFNKIIDLAKSGVLVTITNDCFEELTIFVGKDHHHISGDSRFNLIEKIDVVLSDINYGDNNE